MSDDNPIDLNSPEIQEAIQKATESAVSGLKSKNSELIEKLSGLKTQYADVDLEEYRAFKQQKQKMADEELIAKGDIDSIINQRVEALKQDYESKLTTTAQQAELYKSRVLNGYIATAAAQAGVDASAIEIVAMLASQSGVKLDENGNPVLVDVEGKIRYGKDGQTPLGINDWLSNLRESKPLLWGTPKGSGAVGSSGGISSGKKPKEMTTAERAEWAQRDPEGFNLALSQGLFN